MVLRARGVRGTGKEFNLKVVPFCCAYVFAHDCCF